MNPDRIKKAITYIDIAIAHLKSVAFTNPSASVESALEWLNDAKSELQLILNDTLKNTVIYIDSATALKIARKARVRTEDAVEALIRKCVDEYVSG